MSDLPGTAAVGIETVEWSAESGGNLTVRITGRWRRRRPITTGQPTLVIEAEGGRHRYPAMPEPPSLAGTGPGLWRLSFTVPGWLAPELGRTWLQFGTVIVPLPVAVPAPGEPRPAGPEEDSEAVRPVGLEEDAGAARPVGLQEDAVSPPPVRLLEASGGAQVSAPARQPVTPPPPPAPRPSPAAADAPAVTGLASRVTALEHELHAARAGRDELLASLAERDRSRRIAEQRAHAEQALRQDLARQLSSSLQEAERVRQAMGELAGAEDRIRALESELQEACRRSDEAEQVAAAATAARERAERERERGEAQAARATEAANAESARLRFEEQLRGRRAGAAAWIPAEPLRTALPPAGGQRAPAAATIDSVLGPAGEEPAPGLGAGLVDTLRRELDARARADASMRARLIDAETRLAARVLLDQRTTAALAQVRSELETLRDALARERELRADADRRNAELERQLSGMDADAERRAGELERELAAVRGEGDRRAWELERELSAQRGLSRGAYEAIGQLRGALERLRAPAPTRPPDPEPVALESGLAAPQSEPRGLGPAAGPVEPTPAPSASTLASPARLSAPPPIQVVEPARLNDALTRLRETVPPQDPPVSAGGVGAPRPPTLHEALGRPSLERAFRKLVRRDADAAGRLLLELLPLQRVVYPHAVTYDLVLGPGRGCVCVTVPDGAVTIGVQSTPRPRDEVDFQVLGDPARIARLLVAGRFRRRLGLGVARVRGRRDGVVALSALLGTPLDLGALHHAGVRFDPATAFALVAGMIDPAWTARERFTLAHAEPASATTYVIVREGRPIRVTRTAPEGRITTTLDCKGDQLLAALSGDAVSGLTVSGDERPLASLREWIKRAQSE